MDQRKITQLVLPLLAASTLAILVHLRWPAGGFFLNLAAGFVGSLVTVGYIDWILRRHEKERWKDADSRINVRLSKLATTTITGIRTALGYGTEIFNQGTMATGSAELMRKEVLRIAAHVLSPTAKMRVAALNQDQWKTLVYHLQQASAECGVFLDRFSHRLEPRTITVVLDLQLHLESAQTFWHVFPDIAGVPVDQLPETNTPPDELQAAWCDLTANDIRKVLELSVTLSEETGETAFLNV
jgi:hypothetical protein